MAIQASPISSGAGVYQYVGGVAGDTYANLATNYPASSYTNQEAWCTDGHSGFQVRSNGTRWVPRGMVSFCGTAMPLLSPPTINPNVAGNANGASTFLTAVTPLIQKGYMYVSANTLSSSHAAGWYYFEMSSTTAFTAYNNTYTPGTGTYPTEPTSKTAFSGSVPGAAGDTTELTVLQQSIPAGMLGKYGSVISDISVECNNSAGTKVTKIYIDTQAFCSESLTTSATLCGQHVIQNIGSESSQRAVNRLTNSATVTVAVNGSIDTTIAKNFKVTIQKNTATDYQILESSNIFVRSPL